jgi:hypothetical protein
VAAAIVLGAVTMLVLLSRLSAAYSMADMGYDDYGGGTVPDRGGTAATATAGPII